MSVCLSVCLSHVSIYTTVVRAERRHVREVEVDRWLRATPSKSKSSSRLFRTLADKGQSFSRSFSLALINLELFISLTLCSVEETRGKNCLCVQVSK